MGITIDDELNKIVEEVTETHEKFIFEAIKPFCESVVDMEISKEDLTHALLLWQNYDKQLMDDMSAILDKIRAEIKNDWQLKKFPCSPFSCGLRQAIEIIDKYREEVNHRKVRNKDGEVNN